MFVDHYNILNIGTDADFDAVKRAYYRRAKECHPDLFGGDTAKEEEFKRVARAFNVLSDPRLRREYDHEFHAFQYATPYTVRHTDIYMEQDKGAIMDSFADDALEELIVGNCIPLDTSLFTLLLDLQRTEVFCLFREAKNLYYHENLRTAAERFNEYVKRCPTNILGRYFLARSLLRTGKWRGAVKHLGIAIQLGATRRPPLRLNRMRHELQHIRRQHRGLFSRWFARIPDPPGLPDTPEEKVQQEVNRAIQRLERETPRRRQRLEDGGQKSENAC